MVGSARRIDHQPAGIGVAHQVVDIDFTGTQQFMDQRHDEQAVGARPDSDPFVGDCRIAGAHRVDADELGAARLQFADAGLDRVGIVILGDAEHQEIFGPIPVRFAELPERSADGVEPGCRHVDRAEAAMGRIIRRAELLRPPSGQRLTLVTTGEEGELLRIACADIAEPFLRNGQRLVPLDFLELGLAALADPLQRLLQPRRRIMLHDPGRALAAQHALVDRVVAVALDVANLAVLQVHLDAATAGAHVAGRGLDLVVHRRRQIDCRFSRCQRALPRVCRDHGLLYYILLIYNMCLASENCQFGGVCGASLDGAESV